MFMFLDIDIPGMIDDGLRSAFYFLCKLIYNLIISLYDLFGIISKVRILDISVIEDITGRIGLLAAIIMFFLVAFSFVQYILDPDKVNDKEIGGATLVKKILVVIVLLGTSTYIFKTMDALQETILNGGVVEKLLLPSKVKVSDNFGGKLSTELFLAFYRYNEYTNDADCAAEVQNTDSNFLKQYVEEHNQFPDKLSPDKDCLHKEVDNQKVTSFNGIVALLVGVGAAYFLLMYTISVGIRAIQLAFLQIISPAAIIGYLEPKKDNMFTKWLKIYISTYIDVFVRIAIINLCVFMIAIVVEGIYGGSTSNQTLVGAFGSTVAGATGQTSAYIMVIMVIAILSFAKKAPELLKELLPAGGASKIGFGASLKDAAGLGMVAGAFTGAATGIVGGIAGGKGISRLTGAFSGIAGGAVRGFSAGGKANGIREAIANSNKNQATANLNRAQRIASGATFGERANDALRGTFGIQAGYDKLNQELSMSSNIKTTLEGENIIKHIREVRQSYIQAQASQGRTADANMLARYDEAEKTAMRQMYAFSHNNDSGDVTITVQDTQIGLDLSETYSSNRGIYNQIKNNEKRAGHEMQTYDDWKTDNNSIKNKIADKTKSGK